MREHRARLLDSPVFEAVRGLIAVLPEDRWPTHEELTSLAQGVFTSSGQPLRFVPPRDPAGREHRHYESHIAATGEVQTRVESWHDLFNALAWIAFPKTKARINEQHARILAERGDEEARHRSPERDALTLFDEGGVIVASSSPELLRLVVAFDWKELFWRRRDEVAEKMRFIAFGHGLFEQSLAPYIGMVAKTVFVPVGDFFFMLQPDSQREEADQLAAAHFASPARFASPRAMPPMPVLGVPGWHFAAQDEAFYDDASHFRSKGPKITG